MVMLEVLSAAGFDEKVIGSGCGGDTSAGEAGKSQPIASNMLRSAMR